MLREIPCAMADRTSRIQDKPTDISLMVTNIRGAMKSGYIQHAIIPKFYMGPPELWQIARLESKHQETHAFEQI